MQGLDWTDQTNTDLAESMQILFVEETWDRLQEHLHKKDQKRLSWVILEGQADI